jgi:hypothetical protein
MAFYAGVYEQLYTPVRTSPYPPDARGIGLVHSLEDHHAGMRAYFAFMKDKGSDYRLPGDPHR